MPSESPPGTGLQDEGRAVRRLIGYIHRVADNLLADSGHRSSPVSLDEPATPGGDGTASPLAERLRHPGEDVCSTVTGEAERDAVTRILMAQFGELTPQQRAILRLDLACDRELPDADIAAALKTTPNCVRNQRSRALARLRAALDRLSIEDAESAAWLERYRGGAAT